MQAIVHKAEVDLIIDPVSAGICPSDTASLVLNPDATVNVFVEKPVRLPFRAGATRLIHIGTLESLTAEALTPALKSSAHLRVRIVEVEPPHVTRTGKAAVFLSVWGNVADTVRPKPKTGIFTRSIINDLATPRDQG